MSSNMEQVSKMIISERVSVVLSGKINKIGYDKYYLTEKALQNSGLKPLFIDCAVLENGFTIIKELVEKYQKDTVVFSNMLHISKKKVYEFIDFVEKSSLKIIFLNREELLASSTLKNYLTKFPTTRFA